MGYDPNNIPLDFTWCDVHSTLAGMFGSFAYWWCYNTTDPWIVFQCEHGQDFAWWDYESCQCIPGASPIVIDLGDAGIRLTSAERGVRFDIKAGGQPVQVAWTQRGSQDAFLVLDRNENGMIDDGSELFGNYTVQPDNPPFGVLPNGFLALSVFDKASAGGNGDEAITSADAIFDSLRLWVDVSHDGVSQPQELRELSERGVSSISLRYTNGRRRDEHGNVFLYRSRVEIERDPSDTQPPQERWAVDVFLVTIAAGSGREPTDSALDALLSFAESQLLRTTSAGIAPRAAELPAHPRRCARQGPKGIKQNVVSIASLWAR